MKYLRSRNINNYQENIRNIIRKHIESILLIGRSNEKNYNNKQQLSQSKIYEITLFIDNLLYTQSENFHEYSNIETLKDRLKSVAFHLNSFKNSSNSKLNSSSIDECKEYPSHLKHKNQTCHSTTSTNSINSTNGRYTQSDPVFICLPFNLTGTRDEEFYQISKIPVSNSRFYNRICQAEFQYQS